MSFEPGQTMLHYQLIGKLGAGGMGEVWRARDTSLKREVAIKLLPAGFAADAERRARFENEARTLAALNHPNIATIYGLHIDQPAPFLAMELVPGTSLEERLALGALPIDEAVAIAGSIARALEIAHDGGIVHRDLKPANVMLTPDGIVKVLDFGLAKVLGDDTGGPAGDPAASPTVTSLGTQAGMILGTAAYMSPEQARGLPVDRRADVWALGVVLFEMLTGRRLFAEDTVSDTLAAVLRADLDLDALPDGVPQEVRRVLARFLERDPVRRLRDAGELRFVADEYAAHGDVASREQAAPQASGAGAWRFRALLIPAALVLGVAVGALAIRQDGPEQLLSWLTIPPLADQVQYAAPSGRTGLSLSPDGQRVSYVLRSGSTPVVVTRSLDDPAPKIVPGTEHASRVIYSPDSRSIVVNGRDRLLLLPAEGGAGRELCRPCNMQYGGTWAADDTLVLAPNWASGLLALPIAGGQPMPLTTLDRQRGDVSHVYPYALPGGRKVLFTIWTPAIADRMAAVVGIDDGQVQIVARGGNHYGYTDGHLLFERNGVLYAQRLDLGSLEVSGSAVVIVSGLQRKSVDGYAQYSVSQTGVLAFQQGSDGEPAEALWVDREGNTQLALPGSENLTDVALSSDGTMLAAAKPEENSGYQVQVFDLAGGTRTRLTHGGDNLVPLFSPDGKRVLFVSSLFDNYVIAEATVDGSTPPAVAVDTRNFGGPTDWSPDGTQLVYDRNDDNGVNDIWITDFKTPPRVVMAMPANESGATFSPDGKWLAYTSDATGSRQLYVVSADGSGAPRQVTQDGTSSARWSRLGGEIIMQRDEQVWSLPVSTSPTLRVGTAVRLFDLPGMKQGDAGRREFSIAPDGRFLILRYEKLSPERSRIHVIQNLPELLRRRSAAL